MALRVHDDNMQENEIGQIHVDQLAQKFTSKSDILKVLQYNLGKLNLH